MFRKISLVATTLSLFLAISSAQAQTLTYTVDADNDLAIYVGNATGSNLRQVIDKTTNWNTVLSGSFTLQAGEDYFYMVCMNYGGPGDIGGIIGGTSIVNMPGWVSKDITGQLTGYPSGIVETFNPQISEIQSLISAGNFNTTPSVGNGTTATLLGTQTFITPSGVVATLFRQQSAIVAGAPEPGTLALLALGGLALLKRRKH